MFVCTPSSQDTVRKQQLTAPLPWIQIAQTTAALPDQAPLNLLAGESGLPLTGHADNSPEVGQDHIAGCGVALLGSPATSSWQGNPAGTPSTPLSSHPIDALEESEVASASTSTTNAASNALLAHSRKHSGVLRSAESEAPFNLELGNMGAPTVDEHLPITHLDRGGSDCLHTDAQPQFSSLMPRQGIHCSAGQSMPLEADAVMLEMASDLSASIDGLISPDSSVASWQRHLAAHSPASSSHSSKLPPAMSSGEALSLDRYQQHLPHSITESTPECACPVDSRPDGRQGFCHASAPMSDSPPLPGSWDYPDQPHHHPCQQQQSVSGATSPSSAPWQQKPGLQDTHDYASQSSQRGTPTVTADYAAAAAQLQQAVAQAEQLYRASMRMTESSQQCDVWSNSVGVIDQAGAACPDTSGQDQVSVGGFSQHFLSALPDSRRLGVQHAMRRGAEPACPMQQPVWVPQGNHPCSCSAQHCLSYRQAVYRHLLAKGQLELP